MKSYLPCLALMLVLTGCASTGRPLQFVAGADPGYPPEAKAQGIEGYVVVRYDVDAEGRVGNVAVAEASPPGVFDAAAVKAVKSYQFRPPLVDGTAEGVDNLTSRFEFKLSGADKYPR